MFESVLIVCYDYFMRGLLARVFINSLSLFLVSLVFSGLVINGGYVNYIIAGALLTFFSSILDPFVKIITLPFRILTLGLISFATTTVSLFAVTLFFKNVVVHAFTFTGLSFWGLEIGTVQLSTLLSFVVISATIYFSNKLMDWLFAVK